MTPDASGHKRSRAVPLLLALSVGLVLSDSSVVTLALPAILRELHCSVSAVAWVLIAFNLALAVAAVPGAWVARRRPRPAFVAASVAFAAASLVCATAPSLGLLVAARAAQGVLGAVVVAAALELLALEVARRRAIGLWAAAGVLGGALGPALGGFLTQSFSWEAMFALQAPVALLALAGAWRTPAVEEPTAAAGQDRWAAASKSAASTTSASTASTASASAAPSAATASGGSDSAASSPAAASAPSAASSTRPPITALVALALVSAALAAALFLLVVMLIEGWRLSPGVAALVVTAMPLAALVAGRWARDGHRLAPALPGCVLLAGGLAALGLLPGTGAAWTIAPQLAIGSGLGLALGALIGVIVDAPGDAAIGRPAAWTIAARHAGIVVGLLVLTPIFTADLAAAGAPAQRAGLADLLDAPIALKPKLALARSLGAEVADTSDQQLPDLHAGFAAVDVPAVDHAAAQRLEADLDDDLDRAATSAFSRSFLAAALLALLGAGAVAVAVMRSRGAAAVAARDDDDRFPPATAPDLAAAASTNGHRLERAPSLNVALPAACALATLLVAAYVALGGANYGPTAVADPCAQRARPAVERSQRIALATIDGAACSLHVGREDLLLTLVDGNRPAGVSNAQFEAALLDGIDRAEREGALGKLAAIGLRLAIRAGGALGVVGQLLPR
jgi:MFS family permease